MYLFGPANRKTDHSMKLKKFGYCILKMYDTCIDGIPLFWLDEVVVESVFCSQPIITLCMFLYIDLALCNHMYVLHLMPTGLIVRVYTIRKN